MVVLAAPSHFCTWHSSPLQGPSGIDLAMSPPRLRVLPVLTPLPPTFDAAPPVAAVGLDGFEGPISLSGAFVEHDVARAAMAASELTTLTRRKPIALSGFFMATPGLS